VYIKLLKNGPTFEIGIFQIRQKERNFTDLGKFILPHQFSAGRVINHRVEPRVFFTDKKPFSYQILSKFHPR